MQVISLLEALKDIKKEANLCSLDEFQDLSIRTQVEGLEVQKKYSN